MMSINKNSWLHWTKENVWLRTMIIRWTLIRVMNQMEKVPWGMWKHGRSLKQLNMGQEMKAWSIFTILPLLLTGQKQNAGSSSAVSVLSMFKHYCYNSFLLWTHVKHALFISVLLFTCIISWTCVLLVVFIFCSYMLIPHFYLTHVYHASYLRLYCI